MKAYLTTIGEKTTQICKEQLERFGFKVVMLDEPESWFDKYKRFICLAEENCIRIDADIIPNANIVKMKKVKDKSLMMVQFANYDFYRNNIWVGQPIYYSKKGIKVIRNNLEKLRHDRPETGAWRLDEVLPHTASDWTVVGLNGFFQDKKTMERAKRNKILRRQIQEYDFNLVDKIIALSKVV